MRLRALIADDEQLARERLRLLLRADSAVDVTGECRNGREAVAALRNTSVDVLFLDVQMPGLGGFEVLAQSQASSLPAVVFVTAYDRYAVKAFEASALDYLTKPVEIDRLRATLARVRSKLEADRALLTQEKLRIALEDCLVVSNPIAPTYLERIVVSSRGRDIFVAVSEIDWIEAADYYSCLHVGDRTLMLRETIKQLAERLDPIRFVRIHRSVIVNVDRVKEVIRLAKTESSVVLHNGVRLRMSYRGWQILLYADRTGVPDPLCRVKS